VNADDLFEGVLIEKMLRKFKESKADIVLSYKPVEETWKFGIIKVEKDKVMKLVEKPPKGQEESNLAVLGIYLMTKKIFSYLKKTPVSDHQYEDAIQKFIEDKNNVRAVSYDRFFAGYKYPWDLFRMNAFLMDSQIKKQTIEENVQISESAKIEGNVWVKKGAKILDNACVKGPCYVGANTIIGNNCLVRSYASIGDNCIIGFTTEIKTSLIGDNCLFHMNYVGDSIISDNCLFGAGATTANFRFDEKNVKAMVNGKKVDSGANKLGVIMGDNSKVGINSSLAPGVKVGPYSIVGAGINLQEDLEACKMILLDRKYTVTRENTITISPAEKAKLTKLLKKYEQAK
jgi:bifunctional UDP-N-acetylglucosamine pyrophosphorylase/glucosamine-1-phosphate N-acetyltransferase